MTAAGRIYRAGAVLFAGIAGLCGYFWIRLPWAPTTDFDVIGILWLLQNLPKLVAVAGTSFGVAMAGYCWIRSLRFR